MMIQPADYAQRFLLRLTKQTERERYEALYQEILDPQGNIIFAGTLAKRAALLFPDNIALWCKDTQITHKELFYRAHAVSLTLQHLGVTNQDRVCLLFENSIEFYLCYWAIWQLGAVVIPLNIFLHLKELIHILSDARPAAFIISDTLAHKLQDIPAELLPHVLTNADLALNQPVTVVDPNLVSIVAHDPDHVAALLYTSGTTGLPKGVMLSSRNILTNVVQGMARLNASPADRVYGILPLFHSFAQLTSVWGPCFVGASVIVVPKIERQAIIEGLAKKPTVVMGVPSLYGLFCLMKTLPFSDVRYFISGGDALPDKIRGAFEMVYRRKLCNGYGLTETSPFIAVDLEDELKPTSTVGKPALDIEVSIRDEAGNQVEPGSIGILWVKGPNVMLGYYNAPQETQKVLKDGWFNTGDFACMDEQGRLVMSGRHKDLIINKGFNIYPQEIENVLMSHPAVFAAGVIGIPDPEVGETPVAFISLRQELPESEKTLKKWCSQHLAAYKVPRHIIVLKEMPLTSVGKVDKKRLRAEYAQKT